MTVAAYNNPNQKVLTVLLEAGTNAKAKSNEGKTALDYARENEALKGTQALKLLEEKTGQNGRERRAGASRPLVLVHEFVKALPPSNFDYNTSSLRSSFKRICFNI